MSTTDRRITTEQRGHIALVGINRPEKRNAFDLRLLGEFATALTEADEHPDVRCVVVFAHGDHFTGGLDLADVAPAITQGKPLAPEGTLDPWAVHGRARTKPLVIAVQGRCLTLGIELVLAADIAVAAEDTRFAQIEIKRGIFPFGGATIRFPAIAGWGNAMRWLLTADELDAREAHRIGLVQEVVPVGRQLERAIELAERIARQAPLGVRATLESARLAQRSPDEAARALLPRLLELAKSDDAREGLMAFLERRDGRFSGR